VAAALSSLALSSLDPSTVFRLVDLLGVLINGILGGQLARHKHFDAVGFAVLAVLSGLGGGMVRDVLLQSGQPIALTDPWYLPTALVGAAVALLWKLESRPWRVVLIIADGTALGCWAATGVLKALGAGLGVVPAVLMGLITAVGGGMVRDVCAGNVPRVFGGNTLYATPALASAVLMAVLARSGHPTLGMGASILLGMAFTVVAHRRRWMLPQDGDWTLALTSAQVRRLLAAREPREPRGSREAGGAGTNGPRRRHPRRPSAASDGDSTD